MADDSKHNKSIPSWQQAAAATSTEETSTDVSVEPTKEMLEIAREFLADPDVKDSPREDKVAFLSDKGLDSKTIEKLLAEEPATGEELKTIHDSNAQAVLSEPASQPSSTISSTVQPTQPVSKSEVAPIITYPEFLLKPEKPPPLITISRLVSAAYAIAGVSALTWGASKYIVEPMLQNLTEARHDFADTTAQDLEKLNEKLEGVVSHVPYIASSAVRKAQENFEDDESVDSDPTELFHRDIATQTSPGLSRTTSETNLASRPLEPTIAQAQRLSGLEYSLKSLVQSMEHAKENEKYLRNTTDEFQKKLDSLESSYSMLKNDYWSSSVYSSAGNDAKKNAPREQEAQRFKQEIRALKGAFLSSRNFPTARPAATMNGQR